MSRAFNIPKLNVVSSSRAMNIHRECYFQKTSLFFPINFCHEINALASCRKDDFLFESRFPEFTFNQDSYAQRIFLQQFN